MFALGKQTDVFLAEGYYYGGYSYGILAVTCMSMQQLVWVIAVIAALHCTEHLMHENVYYYLEWRK